MPHEIQIGHPLRCVAQGTIAVGSSDVGIPASDLDKCQGGTVEAMLSIEGDQVRIAFPAGGTTATGHRFNVDDVLRVAGPQACRDLRMVQVTGAATVRYSLWDKPVRAI